MNNSKNFYQKDLNGYKNAFFQNLENYPLIKSLFKNKNLKELKRSKNLNKLMKSPLVMYVSLNFSGIAKLEELLKKAVGIKGYNSVLKELRDNIYSYKFFDILNEVIAANILKSGNLKDLRGQKVGIEFLRAGKKDLDIIYEVNSEKYFVSVKSFRNLDPVNSILHETLLRRSLYKETYRNKTWEVKVIYFYNKDDFTEKGGKRKLDIRVEDAIGKLFDMYEKNPEDTLKITINDIQFDCKVKTNDITINSRPILIYSNRFNRGFRLDKKDQFYKFGKIYARIIDESYKAFLDFYNMVKGDDRLLEKCRLMIIVDWPISKVLYEKEIEKAISSIIKILGLDEFMKVDVK